MKIGLIGDGAIAGYVRHAIELRGHTVTAILVRPEKADQNPLYVGSLRTLPDEIDLMIDCAGHSALTGYGPRILERGTDMITVSLGALADDALYTALETAAIAGGSRLHLASGAVGALDCLNAAQVGGLEQVTYVGRKPPSGWAGSLAEMRLDLAALTTGAHIHFDGSARDAALAYPKNANVAAAVALAGLGFDKTGVKLIADTGISANIHEITAQGSFGSFHFQISGKALPDNPRSSALAAMSVVSKLAQTTSPISI